MEKIAAPHAMRPSNFFHTNPYNFSNIPAAIKSYSCVSPLKIGPLANFLVLFPSVSHNFCLRMVT